jgi:hypothetical protein
MKETASIVLVLVCTAILLAIIMSLIGLVVHFGG